MNYTETIDFLYTHLPMFQRVGLSALKKDLSNTRFLCGYLNNPHTTFKSVHIAGTNGKGSSAHTLAAILQCAGYKTGLYTSPHLKEFTERIKINGKEINEEQVVRFVEKIKPAIEKVHPSFFEVTVAMAFDIFAEEKIDIAIIETGLGGRLDSTNVIHPEVSLITNIGFDHQAILGNTLTEIAAEKAGIIKQGTPVVIGEYQQEIAPLFQRVADQHQAPIYFAEENFEARENEAIASSLSVTVYKNQQVYLSDLNLSLGGKYQLKNIPGILQTVEVLESRGLRIGFDAIRQGFEDVKSLTGLKGRWQTLQQDPLVICDTGHNESGISYVVKQLESLDFETLHMVIGVANDKKLEGIFSLLPKQGKYYFCQANIPRALEASSLAEQAAAYGLNGEVIPDVNEAIKTALEEASRKDVIFIGGSSFVVAEIEGL